MLQYNGNQDIKQTAFVYNENISLPISQQRKKLPIYQDRLKICHLVEKFQVLILIGETGTGKSTQIPQYLYEVGWTNGSNFIASSSDSTPNLMIGVTQPRRIAATSLASRVSDEMGQRFESQCFPVGYTVRFDDYSHPESTKIRFMTEGILIQHLLSDPYLTSYSVIMLDEVHERTVQVDLLMALLKKVCEKRPDFRLIITSATIDAEFICEYFNDFVEKSSVESGKNSIGKAIIHLLPQTSFSVTVHYLDEPCPNYVKCSAETAIKIHNSEPQSGDILIFLTGLDEIQECISLLNEHVERFGQSRHGFHLQPLPLHSSLIPSEQIKAFRPPRRGFRKVIVSTNVAESSVTIDNVCYIIDSCFAKVPHFVPEINATILSLERVSLASSRQRAGRAGRTRPGHCYRLCTESDFDGDEHHRMYQIPEIQRSSFSTTYLVLKSIGVQNILRFNYVSSPSASVVMSAMNELNALGVIDNVKGDVVCGTEEGRWMTKLGLMIQPLGLARSLIESKDVGCTREVAAIVAMLQVDSVFSGSIRSASKRREVISAVGVSEGDLITHLNIFNRFHSLPNDVEKRKWCSRRAISYKIMLRVVHIYERILKTLIHDFDVQFNPKLQAKGDIDTDVITKCLLSGLFMNVAKLNHMSLDAKPVYSLLSSEDSDPLNLYFHPKSVFSCISGSDEKDEKTLLLSMRPEYVMFCELVHNNHSTSFYMKDVGALKDGDWLPEVAPHYYQRKESVV